MGIFSRLTDIINSNINALLDKAEDPEKMVRLIIQEMEETLVEVRTQSAKLIADKKELGRRGERLTREADDWETKAETALANSREDLARAALKEKTRALETAELIANDLGVVEENLLKLGSDITALQQKLGDAKSRQKALIVRSKAAEVRPLHTATRPTKSQPARHPSAAPAAKAPRSMPARPCACWPASSVST